MIGRPPKPTALKILQGNPGQRRLNDAEPKPPLGADPPVWLRDDPVLLAEWKRHAARLLRLGLLTEIDDDALCALTVLSVKFREMVAAGAEANVLINITKELRAMWGRFGMTPADRSRVKVEKPAPKTKLEKFRAV
jgi:hypothetical protein